MFFHSSAHVLGQALERTLGSQLTVGPALKEGFYYDCYMGADTITEEKNYGPLEKCISSVVKVGLASPSLTLALTPPRARSGARATSTAIDATTATSATPPTTHRQCLVACLPFLPERP